MCRRALFLKMKNKKLRMALFVHIIIVILEMMVVNYMFAVNGMELFKYYTDNSNLLCLITSAIFVIFMLPAVSKGRTSGFVSTYMMQHYKGSVTIPEWLTIIRYVTTCCLGLTCIVVLLVLGPKDGYVHQLLSGMHPLDHLGVPLASTLSFLFLENERPLPKNAPYVSLGLTIIYAIVIILLNAMGIVDGPYFFLRIREQSLLLTFIWTVVLLGGDFLLSVVVMKVYNSLVKVRKGNRK